MLISNRIVKKIISRYEKIWSLNYLNLMVGWDTETYMPSEGIRARAKVLSNVSSSIQDLYMEKDLWDLLDEVRDMPGLNIYERKIIRALDKQINIYKKLPKKFVIEFANLIASASTIWAEAREKNNLEQFLPVLGKIFEMTRQKAEHLGYKNNPYEPIFAQYEDDFSIIDLELYFQELKYFLKKISLKGLTEVKMERFKDMSYDISNMEKLNRSLLKFLGADPKVFRLDVSTHPFSIFMSRDDIRLTTNYQKNDFTSSLFPTVHEFGHGLFASQANNELEFTPLWPETSYAIHESQSRFWENMVSREKNFIKVFIKDFRALSPKLKDFSVDDFYKEFNMVEPSLIRVQADEITYHYHIIIRYEVEMALLNKEIDVKEANEMWNGKYQEYLGIKPDTYANGILQDIHWSFGDIGYFPTYSLGSVLSATWLEEIEKELQWGQKEILSKDDIIKLKKWLKNNIHQYAGTYTLKEISQKVTGKEFSVKPWENYIKKKYKISFDN